MSLFATSIKTTVGNELNKVNLYNDNNYKEILKDNVGSPYQLAIDYDTNVLFFSYSLNENYMKFYSGCINLKSKEFEIIKGIKGGFAQTVDRQTKTVYLGGADGVYRFDYKTKTAKHINVTTQSIWQMFFKNNLYYTTYPEEHVYVYKDGQSQRVPQLLGTKGMLVAIDNADNIYFSNSSGLHVYEKNIGVIQFLGDYILNGITSDINGNLFFSTPNEVFSINSENKTIKKLFTMDDIYGIAVESDGKIIYGSENGIIRLKPRKL